jgi:hypothetical protein
MGTLFSSDDNIDIKQEYKIEDKNISNYYANPRLSIKGRGSNFNELLNFQNNTKQEKKNEGKYENIKNLL